MSSKSFQNEPDGKAKAKATPEIEELNVTLLGVLSELVRVYQFRDREKTCYYDLSVTQCYALEAIVHQRGMRQKELTDFLFLNKSTASRTVDFLEANGYVRRDRDRDDGRAFRLIATRKGRALHDKIQKDLLERQRQLVADLPTETLRGAIVFMSRASRAAAKRFADSACAADR
jgi:DNA-binding MarR family transcriptional regulator